MALLETLPWPGNVRQLENAMFRAVVLAEAEEIGLHEFPQLAGRDARRGHVPGASLVPDQSERPCRSTARRAAGDRDHRPPFAPDRLALLDDVSQVRPLDELEAEIIRYAIAHYRGQMSEVARRLRIGRSTLYRKLEAAPSSRTTSREYRRSPWLPSNNCANNAIWSRRYCRTAIASCLKFASFAALAVMLPVS